MRISRLLSLAVLALTAATFADTPPLPTSVAPRAEPHILLMHMTPFKLDVSFPVPAGWGVERLPNGYPLVFLPAESTNVCAAAWTFEFRQNDIGTTSEAVVNHSRDMLAQSKNLTLDETGTAKTPSGLNAGFIRYHLNDSKTAMNRSYFIILSEKEILWISEQTNSATWSDTAPTLSTITNALNIKPMK